ncbi:MAG: sulfurtransferase TusA family protein [Pseudomonadota bacterium]
MESNILDLRGQGCPLALLLAKRHTNQLVPGEQVQLLISDSSSVKDITRYLQQQAYALSVEEAEGYYCMQVTKESC